VSHNKEDKAAEKLAQKAAKVAEKLENKKIKEQAREKRSQELAQTKADLLKLTGSETGREVFGGKTIRFYENGFVSLGFIGAGEPEKLLAIDVNVDVQKKTGLGRAIVGVATVGLNVATTSNMRGDIWVSITTDKKMHMLHTSPPSESSVKSARKIEALAKACLARSSGIINAPVSENQESDLAEQISKLKALRDSGVLSEPEFVAAKAKLLS
jgi:hypothetical protein